MTNRRLYLKRWQSLDPEERRSVLELQISADQIEYAGTVERAVAACESADHDEVAGLAILDDRRVVGFVVLSGRGKRPDWAPADAVALTAMRIDAREQGRGLGRAALGAVEAWLQANWPEHARVALSVDDGNLAGRRAYAAAGFTEYAAPKQGRIGVVRYLSKPVGTAASAA